MDKPFKNIVNGSKQLDLVVTKQEDEERVFAFARALASRDRLRILRLIAYKPLNVFEISKHLSLPISTVSNHISVLEDANLIVVSTQQGQKGHVKMCYRMLNHVHLSFDFFSEFERRENFSQTTEMPVGNFSEINVGAPCGMACVNTFGEISLISTDIISELFDPKRVNAEILWFDSGFVSYNFPNKLYEKENFHKITRLELSFEVCSEIVYHRADWPSDITVKINDVETTTFLSPGDFGGRRGVYSPEDWDINSTQYGYLKKLVIDRTGVHLNDELVAKIPLDTFRLQEYPFVKISIGVKPDAVHRGGINLFGKNWGDYPQAILLTLFSESETLEKPSTVEQD